MIEFGVGDEVEVMAALVDRSAIGKILKVIEAEDGEIRLERCFSTWKQGSPNLKLIRRADMYKQGDVLVTSDLRCNDLTIQGNIGDVYITTTSVGYSTTHSKKELEDLGYTLKTKETITELTLEDISAGKGKGVPSHLLRIKE